MKLKRYQRIIILVLALAALGFAIWNIIQYYRPSIDQVTATGGTKLRPAWSPDGSEISFLQVFAMDAEDGDVLARVFLTDLQGRTPINLTGGFLATGDHYAWSGAGDFIVFRTLSERGDHIAALITTGEGLHGAIYPLEGQGGAGVWSPDWRTAEGPLYFFMMAGPGAGQLVAIDSTADTATMRVLDRFEAPDFEEINIRHYTVVISPNEQHLAYRIESGLFTIPAKGGEPVKLADDVADDSEPVWGPQSNQVAFVSRSGKLVVVSLDGSRQEYGRGFQARGTADWSPKGLIAVAGVKGNEPSRIFTVNPENGKEALLINMPDSQWPRWSPDGNSLIFLQTEERDEKRQTDLWVYRRR